MTRITEDRPASALAVAESGHDVAVVSARRPRDGSSSRAVSNVDSASSVRHPGCGNGVRHRWYWVGCRERGPTPELGRSTRSSGRLGRVS